MSRMTVQTIDSLETIYGTDKAHAHNSLHVIKMAGRFYGDITPKRIGRTVTGSLVLKYLVPDGNFR